jgi:hypothetical protein
MSKSPFFCICGLVCLLFVRDAQSRAGPAEEMQKFIDECNYMIDEMNHCAEGWVDLEQEMIDSVSSFSDAIVFTESLILEETELILDMADRIIQTEDIMIDLVESCDCGTAKGLRGSKHKHVHSNMTSRERRMAPEAPALTAISSGVHAPASEVITKKDLSPSNESAVSFDKCSVMDDLILVMDACIDAFVVYNDDFLQVLSYMDSAILDMGARIVNTECLIVNMSYQIGDMADLIVDTEVLMADMATSCCRGGSSQPVVERAKPLPLNSSLPKFHASTGDDDLLTDCDFDGKQQRRIVAFNRAHAMALSETARKQLQQKMQSLPPVVQDIGRVSYLKKALLPALEASSGGQLTDMMPCDTWWDPFCCAAEVCADMMVEMIEMMADGADWMEEACENCIDEIGKLADDIVKTEENIILMGYAINDMAEYVVVFIDEGLEFMALFCPDSQKTFSLRGDFKMKEGKVSKDMAAALKKGGGVKFKTFVEHMEVSPTQKFARQRLDTDVSLVVATQVATSAKIKSLQNVHLFYSGLKENPFGEFVAMVDVMMEAMMMFTSILADQTRLMTEMFESLVSLSAEEAKMAGMVVTMGGDVTTMGTSLQEEDALMDELDECL